MSDIKQRLLDESFKGQEAMRREALARIEALEAQLDTMKLAMTAPTKDEIELHQQLAEVKSEAAAAHAEVVQTQDELGALLHHAEARLAAVREALTDIDSWRYDTLGQRPRDESANTEVNAAFDRGARMAFYRCSDRARTALASLPAPEAAPTREETIEQCAKVCNRWIKSMNVHESLAADDIAKAILALKAAPPHRSNAMWVNVAVTRQPDGTPRG